MTNEKKIFESLSKFLATAGIASRRAATQMIRLGKVTVNGKKVIDPGQKVSLSDHILCDGHLVKPQQEKMYFLFNKPLGCVTTTHDERGRKTVLDFVKVPKSIRIYPVGRLDINTTGLLILTNDGELAEQLMHPRYQVPKKYSVTLDRPLVAQDIKKIAQGVHLPDGLVKVDRIEINSQKSKGVIVTICSGKNRVIRRLFQSLGYHVKKLDRIGYAMLTKKGLAIGKMRSLTKVEISKLKSLVQQ